MSIINLSFIKRFFKKPVESTGDELIVTITDERGEVRSVDAKEPLGKAVNLPPSLIMQSGEYCFFDQPFTCSEPGLYRFVKPQVCNAQHIVLDHENPLNNIIYFSLMALRGNADNFKSFEQLQKQSTKRLLSLTCGPLSTFVHNLADLQNMRTRIVFTHTLQRANSYNNGHALLEAWIPKLSKYIAVDVDKKCVFRKDTELLDVFELCQSIHAGDSLQIETFADLTYLDLVNFWCKEQYKLRYSGGMVPDIGQIFVKGKGIFAYPGYGDQPEGKLRILFECAPMALLMEEAGGAASFGGGRILDIEVRELAQRTPIFVGSKEEVKRCEERLG